MIHALNFTGARDFAMRDLMMVTLKKYCTEHFGSFTSKDMDLVNDKAWGNGAGWEASMLKIDGVRELLEKQDVADADWLYSVDSDVVFCNSALFDYVNSNFTDYKGITGIHQGGQLAQCAMGDLHNFSGCSIFIRGWVAKKIAAMTEEHLKDVRSAFKQYVITENEDVVLSYLAQMHGAAHHPLPSRLYNSDLGFEVDIQHNDLKPFYHLNYHAEWFKEGKFLGEPVSGKWDIPRVLALKGIEL